MTAAQNEFETMLAKSRTNGFGHRSHPEDCTSGSRSGSHSPTAAPSTSRPHREGGYLNAFDDTESMNSIGTDQSAPLRDGYRLPARNFQANTGPKGVIADARNFEQARRRDLRAKSRKASMATQGHTSATNGFIPSMPSLPPDFASRLAAIDGSSHANGGSHEDTKVSLDNWDRSAMSSSSPDDDEDFMSVWRRQRLLEMQSGDGIYSKRQDARDALTKKRYGRVELVDAGGYLDAVEKTKDDVVVVVLIYDDEDPQNVMLTDCLSNIARKYNYTRFVKLHYLEAEMDPVSTPAILAYKAGELFANLVSIIDEIPSGRSLSAGSIELVFRQHQILQQS